MCLLLLTKPTESSFSQEKWAVWAVVSDDVVTQMDPTHRTNGAKRTKRKAALFTQEMPNYPVTTIAIDQIRESDPSQIHYSRITFCLYFLTKLFCFPKTQAYHQHHDA